MDKNKILGEIESRMKSIEVEYKALAEAHSLVAKTYKQSSIKPLNLNTLVKLAEKSAKAIDKQGVKKTSKNEGQKTKEGQKRQRSSNGFSKNVVEFFRSTGKFQATSSIANKFKSAYPKKSEIELNRYLAVVLSQLKSKKLLSSYSPENKGQTGRLLMWGLPEWMEGSKPKAGFTKK